MANSTYRRATAEVVPIELLRHARFEGGDPELVAALRAGDQRAMTELVHRYGAYVECILARIMHLDSELPDLLHDVFVAALRRIDTLQNPGLLKEWLRGVTLFVARNTLRSRRRRRWLTFMAPEELPEVAARGLPPEAAEAVARTYRTLDRMPVDERIVFSLRFMASMDLQEMAAACGVSLSTIKRRLDRAQRRFEAIGKRDPVLAELFERGEK